MGYLLRRWERAARRAGWLRGEDIVEGLWLCTGLEPDGGDVGPDWAPLLRRATVRSLGTRSAVLALTKERLWVSGTTASMQVDLAHLGVVQSVPPNVIKFEVLIPNRVASVRLAMVKPADAQAACAAIEAARTARWQGLGGGGHEEIESSYGEDIAREITARWILADSSRGAQGPAAMVLGGLLAERGHTSEAQTLFRKVLGDPGGEFSADAAWRLGCLLRDAGELEPARVAFTQVLVCDDAAQRSAALYELGVLSATAGDRTQAESLLGQVADAGDPIWAPIAIARVAEVRKAAGDLEGAEAAYRRAIDTGHATLAPASTVDLAIMLDEQGRTEEAEQLYDQAIATGHQRHAPRAMLNLGNIARNRGDLAAAHAAFRGVIASGEARLANKAWFNIGHMSKDAGDLDTARDAFGEVANADDTILATIARQRLKDMQAVNGIRRAPPNRTAPRAAIILATAAASILTIHYSGFAWTTAALLTAATVLGGASVGFAIVRSRRAPSRQRSGRQGH